MEEVVRVARRGENKYQINRDYKYADFLVRWLLSGRKEYQDDKDDARAGIKSGRGFAPKSFGAVSLFEPRKQSLQ